MNARKASSIASQDLPDLSEFDLKISELTNEASIRQDILMGISNNNNNNNKNNDNEQDLSDYDEYLKELENEEYPHRPGRSDEACSQLDLDKSSKLDTIDESSLTEGMHLKIKKLQLNKKSEEVKPGSDAKPALTLAERIKLNNSSVGCKATVRQSVKRSVVTAAKSPSLVG